MPLTDCKNFVRLLARLGCRLDGESVWRSLHDAYNEPWRAYHTFQHIEECLQLFARYRHLADKPLEVEFAIWLHDAVYQPKALDNEENSASWARALLLEGGIEDEIAFRVYELILATRHSQEPETDDERLLLDIDLGIFAASTERFAEYQRQIRREYVFVPEIIYRAKRAEVLNSFYNSPVIYHRAELREALEADARLNLRQALLTL